MNEEEILLPIHQRKYICETITELVHDDVVAMYRFLSTHIKRDTFNVHGNGCSVNLDNINDNIVQLVYTFIRDKRNE
jgi:hypothetical protein